MCNNLSGYVGDLAEVAELVKQCKADESDAQEGVELIAADNAANKLAAEKQNLIRVKNLDGTIKSEQNRG